MKISTRSRVLTRIEEALVAAAHSISPFLPGKDTVEFKSATNPVTEADRTANCILRDALLQNNEGWLSEESVDDFSRLDRKHVWVVDPIDGTKEFISRIPEWCISVAFVEDGRAVAGGICNPASREMFLGALGEGVKLNGGCVRASDCQSLEGAIVLASRSELDRGEWDCFRDERFLIRPMGSVAYKLALVAAGMADATWTLSPKNEWDVAAGVALIEAAGGFVRKLDGSELRFNNRSPLFPGLLACAPQLDRDVNSCLRARAGQT